MMNETMKQEVNNDIRAAREALYVAQDSTMTEAELVSNLRDAKRAIENALDNLEAGCNVTHRCECDRHQDACGPSCPDRVEIQGSPVILSHGRKCGSGWTGDRCTKLEGHKGEHSNP